MQHIKREQPEQRSLAPTISSRVLDLLAIMRETPGLRLVDPSNFDPHLPVNIVTAMRGRITGDSIRAGGLSIIEPNKAPTLEQWGSVIDWHDSVFPDDGPKKATLSEASKLVERALESSGYTLETPGITKLYRVTSALQHAVQMSLGYIDPDDLAWFMDETLKIKDHSLHSDSGYFMAVDPVVISGYQSFEGGFYGHGKQILAALGCDMSHERCRQLLNHSVLLEIDLAGYSKILPSGYQGDKILVLRDRTLCGREFHNSLTLEVAAPLPPPSSAIKIIAVVESDRP